MRNKMTPVLAMVRVPFLIDQTKIFFKLLGFFLH